MLSILSRRVVPLLSARRLLASPSLPSASGFFLSPSTSSSLSGSRALSIMGTIQEKLVSRRIEKIDEEFQAQMKKMVALETFELKDFLDEIDAGLNTWSVKAAAAVSTNKEIETLKATSHLLNALLKELPDGKFVELDRKAKLRVSARAGRPVEDVNEAISQFTRMRIMHGWLRERHSKALPMPKSQAEAQLMLTKAATGAGAKNNPHVDKKIIQKAQQNSMRKAGMG